MSYERYNLFARSLHWIIAILIFGLIALGVYMHELPKTDPNRADLYNLHKSLGISTLVLVLIRLAWIRLRRPPSLPSILSRWEARLAKTVHVILYLLMLATPLAGYALSTFADKPVNVFGLVTLPALFAPDEALADVAKEVHEVLAFSLLGIAALHIAGALKHRFWGPPEADVLKRMW